MLPALVLLLADAPIVFPERVPVMMEACVEVAVADKAVTDEDGDYKYICSGDAAAALWDYLEHAGIEPYEQQTATEGRWLGRGFPLGACFRQIRTAEGATDANGLSCTLWLPHP